MPQDYFAILVQPPSQSEAEAGTNNDKPMTALRTKQLITQETESLSEKTEPLTALSSSRSYAASFFSGNVATNDLFFNGQGAIQSRQEGVNNQMRLVCVGAGVNNYLVFDRANGTVASPTGIQAADVFGIIIGVGFDGVSASMTHGPEIHLLATENWSATNNGNAIDLKTIPDGSTTVQSSFYVSGENAGLNTAGNIHTINSNFGVLSLNGVAGGVLALRSSNTTKGLVYTDSVDMQLSAIGATPKMKFDVNGATRLQLGTDGTVGIGATDATAMLDVASDTIRLRTSRTPASASASGNAGDICWDSSYIYVCVSTDTWRRVAHASW